MLERNWGRPVVAEGDVEDENNTFVGALDRVADVRFTEFVVDRESVELSDFVFVGVPGPARDGAEFEPVYARMLVAVRVAILAAEYDAEAVDLPRNTANEYAPLPTVKTTALEPEESTEALTTPGVPGTNAPAIQTGEPPSVIVAAEGATERVGTRTEPTALGGSVA